jgi:hypothetical protein
MQEWFTIAENEEMEAKAKKLRRTPAMKEIKISR